MMVVIEINSIEEDFSIIEEFGEEIKLYVNSDIRLEIMSSLFTSPSTLKLLHKSTGINYTSISTNIAKLESKNIIKKEKDYYYLRKQAAIKLVNLLFLEHNLIFLYDFENYLNNHQVKNDEIEILSSIPFIQNVDLVQANNINPDIAIETLQENMSSKGSVKSMAVLLQSNYKQMIKYLMDHESDFEIITTENLTKRIISHIKEYGKENPPKCKRFNLYEIEDDFLNLALVVSPDKVVLGLFRREGKFNKSCVLVSHEEQAVVWAYNLFNEYATYTQKTISMEDIVEEEKSEV